MAKARPESYKQPCECSEQNLPNLVETFGQGLLSNTSSAFSIPSLRQELNQRDKQCMSLASSHIQPGVCGCLLLSEPKAAPIQLQKVIKNNFTHRA